jgi:hypothetical protein
VKAPAIERSRLHEAETLGRGDERGVHGTEGQISVGGYELGDPDPVGCANRFRDQPPAARSPRKRTSASAPSRVSSR